MANSDEHRKILLMMTCFTSVFAGYGFYGDAFILAGRSSQSTATGKGTGLTSLNGIASVIPNSADSVTGTRRYSPSSTISTGWRSRTASGSPCPTGVISWGPSSNTVGVQLYRRGDLVSEIPNIDQRRDYVRDFLPSGTFFRPGERRTASRRPRDAAGRRAGLVLATALSSACSTGRTRDPSTRPWTAVPPWGRAWMPGSASLSRKARIFIY
ncbi:MAG: hypothetical protein U5N26_02135 [Candidatus Marinimicrobia bacterium]|nr:hypothetical protein [Candidatus Neomarinimicrobiota bacterium]